MLASYFYKMKLAQNMPNQLVLFYINCTYSEINELIDGKEEITNDEFLNMTEEVL